MTNGQVTKRIMKFVFNTKNDSNAVYAFVIQQLRKLPFSSKMFVYDTDLAQIKAERGEEMADTVLAACIATDEAKWESLNDPYDPGFGRYNQKGNR